MGSERPRSPPDNSRNQQYIDIFPICGKWNAETFIGDIFIRFRHMYLSGEIGRHFGGHTILTCGVKFIRMIPDTQLISGFSGKFVAISIHNMGADQPRLETVFALLI